MESEEINTGTNSIVAEADLGVGDAALWKYWELQEQVAKKQCEAWERRGHKVVERYRDDRSGDSDTRDKHRYNILWSNVQTLMPALFARVPKADIERRFKDQDDTGRLASILLERAVNFTLEAGHFGDAMNRVVQDRLLPGRGVMRAVYVPHFQDAPELGSDGALADSPGESVGTVADLGDDGKSDRKLVYEETKTDYVFWTDYLEGPARTWKEVPWVRYRAYMTRAELVKRFGEAKGNKVKLDYSPNAAETQAQKEGDPAPDAIQKAIVHETWDRQKRRVNWWAPGTPNLILDQVDDPLRLTDFFPNPDPLFATTTNENRIPVPDYTEYQDQAREMDLLTMRIDRLTRALKVAGVYAADQKQVLQQLLDDNVENKLIPCEDWAALAQDKGGLSGAILWLPIDTIAKVLLGLYEARDRNKQVLFEISGMSDILRGQSDPEETYGAQRLKAHYVTMRLTSAQNDVARFARDMIRIIAEIVARTYSTETISQITGFPQLLPVADLPPGAMAMPDQNTGQQVPTPQLQQYLQQNQPVLNENARRRKEFEKAVDLIREDVRHDFRIEIEADSTIAMDEEREKRYRTEFMQEFIPLLNQVVPIAQGNPAMSALAKELALFAVRGFRVAKTLEETIEAAFDTIAQMPPQNKQQGGGNTKSPMEIQAESQDSKLKAQVDMTKISVDQQIQQQKLQQDAQDSAREAQIKSQEMGLEAAKITLTERRAQIAGARADASLARGFAE